MANSDDEEWLVGPDARPVLARAAAHSASEATLIRLLRAEIGAERTRLVLEQVALRRRAKTKFPGAERMFFTAGLLQQATEEAIARYKAARFPRSGLVADLCCGIGGDLLGIAARGPAVGVDRDPRATRFAAANCRALGIERAEVVTADAGDFNPAACDAWHIDPDRRPQGSRTTLLEACQPDLQVLWGLLTKNPDAAIKLAPAAIVPEAWASTGELEWIGSRRECRQQVAWLGRLAQRPGTSRATVVGDAGTYASFSGLPDRDPARVVAIDRLVYEPHPAVIAARLTGALADQLGLAAFVPGVAYLTGGQRLDHPLLATFEVLDVLRLDRRQLRAAIRSRDVGILEIKVRGVKLDPEMLRQQLHPSGDKSATLLIAGSPRGTAVILAQRISRSQLAS